MTTAAMLRFNQKMNKLLIFPKESEVIWKINRSRLFSGTFGFAGAFNQFGTGEMLALV